MAESIGLIGLGLLGSAIAERLTESGSDVLGFDVDEERCRALHELGGRAADSARDVTTHCRRTVLSLPDASISRQVVDELLPDLSTDAIVIDTTTGDPEQMCEIAGIVGAAGGAYLDATVGGSSRQVAQRDVIVMVGGDERACEACRDLFDTFSRQVFYVGESGSGSRMKLAVNLVLGLNRAVLAEGLGFARSLGLDLDLTLEILQSGPAASRAAETKGPKMIREDFEPQARLSQHLKDVRLILANGADSGARLPFSSLHRALLEDLEAAGYGAADNCVVIKAFDGSETAS